MDTRIQPIFEFNLNNSNEDVPFITISNSNSSKNRNSKTSSKNHNGSLTNSNNSSSNSNKNIQNSSFNIIRSLLFEKNSNINKESSDIMVNLTSSGYDNITKKESLSEDQKEIKAEINDDKNVGYKTPKKEYNNNIENYKKEKNKKEMLITNNTFGKNLMAYFENINVKFRSEDKNKVRASSIDNNIKNKFLNKNIFLPKKPINPFNNNENRKKLYEYNNNRKKANFLSLRSNSISKITSLKNHQIEFKPNNTNFKNLLNKFTEKKTDKSNKNVAFSNSLYFLNNNCYMNHKNEINSATKISYDKKNETPKLYNYKARLSSSNSKIRESAPKNLFQDFLLKQRENIKRLSCNKGLGVKKTKDKKAIIFSPFYDRFKIKTNLFSKIRKDKKDVFENKNNIKRINQIKKIGFK